MTGTPTDVIDHYQQMAMGKEEAYHLDENAHQKYS